MIKDLLPTNEIDLNLIKTNFENDFQDLIEAYMISSTPKFLIKKFKENKLFNYISTLDIKIIGEKLNILNNCSYLDNLSVVILKYLFFICYLSKCKTNNIFPEIKALNLDWQKYIMNELFTNEQKFINNCLLILEKQGSPNLYWDKLSKISCVIPYEDQTVTYADEIIVIVKSTTSSALLIKKLDNGNPVVCRANDGKVYRIHGEYIHLIHHVENLLKIYNQSVSIG